MISDGTTQCLVDPFISLSHAALHRAPQQPFLPFHGQAEEVREVGKLLGDVEVCRVGGGGRKRTTNLRGFFCLFICLFWLLSSSRQIWATRREESAEAGGMDTHVKEGQLYVQHQKFGKVIFCCSNDSQILRNRNTSEKCYK